MNTAAPKLREDLELISGMDDLPLIFDPATGVYHRISRSGRILLGYLDGSRTTDDLMLLLSKSDPHRPERFRHQLDAFVSKLDDSGLLVGSAPPPAADQGRFRTSMMMPRVIVTRALPTVLEPIAAALRAAPLRLLAGVAVLGAVAGFALGAHTLFASAPPAMHQLGWAFLTAVGVQLLLVLIHENAHALVAQINRAPVRGLGFALLFYVMPVAYVDRTDAYRLRGRGGRIAIALAGMASDGWFCGITAIVALRSTGFTHHTATILLGIQMLGLFVNLNPLLPTDGYTAIETATGLVDLRGRSFTLLKRTASRRSLPSYLATLSRRARAGYLAYGTASAIYVCFVILVVLSGTVRAIQAAIPGAGG